MMVLGLGVFLAAAAWLDWRKRKLPNWLLFPAMLAGLVFQIKTGAWWTAVGGIACGFAITVVPVAMRTMGMGDQKLLMTIGAWTSWLEVYWLVVLSAMLCALAVAIVPHRFKRLCQHLYQSAVSFAIHRKLWVPDHQRSALTIPFAVAVFGAYLIRRVAGLWL